MLDLLFEDEYYAVINKPHGMLVHRTKLAADVDENALYILRDQLGLRLYPVHRLDRKTSGCLVFAKSSEAHAKMTPLFTDHNIKKVYHAVVRGYTDLNGEVDYDLTNDRGKTQNAITRYKALIRYEVPWEYRGHDTSRYSLLEVMPLTGRFHQIRKHMNHLRHPIIGDRPHGCNKQNRLWKQKRGLEHMMLHAESIAFTHPYTQEEVLINAEYQLEMQSVISFLSVYAVR